jgi:hypothetical protein
MLDIAEIQEELARITYKPGWRFLAYAGEWEGPHLVIQADLPDAYNPGQTVVVDIHSMLPPFRDVAGLHAWLAWRLGRIEIHEMREFFRVDGKPIFDPHAPGAERDNSAYHAPAEQTGGERLRTIRTPVR